MDEDCVCGANEAAPEKHDVDCPVYESAEVPARRYVLRGSNTVEIGGPPRMEIRG